MGSSQAITPDTKDWTWVLERPCPECGFEAAAHDVSDLPGAPRGHGVLVVAGAGPR